MSIRADTALVPIPGAEGDGLTHEEFLAVNGVAPIPSDIPDSPHPVIVYEQAIRAVQACRTIDEARYWDNKSDALAAWAKIYADDRVLREARALKLRAWRRIGEIATEIRPKLSRGRLGMRGPNSLLIEEYGFQETRAREIVRIAQMPEKDFVSVAESERPPSPTYLVGHLLRPNPLWADVSHRMQVFLSKARKTDPAAVAATLDEKQADKAWALCAEIRKWIDEFEKSL